MSITKSHNKKIAKNTLLLYIRLLITMSITLYTSRLILKALGVEDYGIYNVVGGIVVLFSFINASMSSAASRFITFELGKETDRNLQKIFSATCTIHLIIALLVVLISETVGLYFLLNKLVIPDGRKPVAMLVFQFSVGVTALNILQTPYVALIFAHERINVYALIEIFSSIFKLLIALLISFVSFDRLSLYSILLFVNSLLCFISYVAYNTKKFKECRFSLTRDKKYILPLFSFSGWDLYGNMAVVARTQGVNMLLNIFFGSVMNAANAIATQIQGAMQTLSTNLLVAVRPRIVKSYAKNDFEYTLWLMNNTVKLTTILLLIFCLPLIIEMPFVLKIWLGEFPSDTVILSRLTLLFIIVANISSCLISVLHASGHIKKISIINGSIYLLVLPLTYVGFKAGFPPYTPFILNIIFVSIGCFLNMFYVKEVIKGFSIMLFFKSNIAVNVVIVIIIVIVEVFISRLLSPGWIRLMTVSFINIFLCIFLSYFLLIENDMKIIIDKKIKNIWKKKD